MKDSKQVRLKRFGNILTLWSTLAAMTLWFVALTPLSGYFTPKLLPFALSLSNSVQDHALGAWAGTIAVLFGAICSAHLFLHGLSPTDNALRSKKQYWLQVVPSCLFMLALLFYALFGDLNFSNLSARYFGSLFRFLASSTFGLGILCCMFTSMFGLLFWGIPQTVRVGFHVPKAAV